jgi:hypothetical protein
MTAREHRHYALPRPSPSPQNRVVEPKNEGHNDFSSLGAVISSSASPWEKRGYRFWGVVGLFIAVFEIGAATAKWWRGRSAGWPTISSTVGHLEDLNSTVGVAVVGLIAGAAFYAFAYGTAPTAPSEQAQGSAAAGQAGARRTLASTAGEFRRGLRIGLTAYSPLWVSLAIILTSAPLAISLYSINGGSAETQYRLGYAIYGGIALFGVVAPAILYRFWPQVVNSPTLFATITLLRDHLKTLSLIVVAGLSILVIHLALYPWPDLAREPSGYAGLNSSQARSMAEREINRLDRGDVLFYTSEMRGHMSDFHGEHDVWLRA